MSRESFDNAQTEKERQELIAKAHDEAVSEDKDFVYAQSQREQLAKGLSPEESGSIMADQETTGELSVGESELIGDRPLYAPTEEEISKYDADIAPVKEILRRNKILRDEGVLSGQVGVRFEELYKATEQVRNWYVRFGITFEKGNPDCRVVLFWRKNNKEVKEIASAPQLGFREGAELSIFYTNESGGRNFIYVKESTRIEPLE